MIPWAKPVFWGKEHSYVAEALSSTWISGGPFVERFEQGLAEYCGIPFTLATSNGTTSIHLAYLALGLRSGDEVIVPGFGFLAAANIALQMSVKPVFAEVDPSTWLVTASEIEKCLSSHTKAIVAVHTYGNICDMDDILSLSSQHNIPVIEDAAEAFGSCYKGYKAGSMGTVGTFSFHATKTVTTGEGGMVTTKHQDLYDTMALYRSHGMLRKVYYWHELAGHNFRLTNIQAALGCAQMESIEEIIRGRNRVHLTYLKFLSTMPGVTPQLFMPEVQSVLWALAVKLDPSAFPQGRDAVIQQMRDLQIETRPGFYSPNLMEFYHSPRLPICEEISQQVISLPTFPTLQDEQIEYICHHLHDLRQ